MKLSIAINLTCVLASLFPKYSCAYLQGFGMTNSNSMAACSSSSKCVPCEGLDDSSKLSLEEVSQRLESSFPLWKLGTRNDGDDNGSPMISRSFVAKNFQAALHAVNAMGAIAEEQGHHPDFHLTSYRNVQIDIYTHSVKGLTENDLQLARLFDAVDVEYSPKWLKENAESQQFKETPKNKE